MKILTSRSSDGGIGGAELSCRDQAYALKSLGNEVVAVSSLKFLRDEFAKKKIKSRRGLWAYRDLGALRYPYFVIVWPLMWLHYLWIVWREKPDVIYPHSRDDQIIFTLLKLLHKRPVMWRDPSDLRYFLANRGGGFMASLHRWFLIKAIARADKIFTLTEEEQSIILDNCDNAGNQNKIQYFGSNILYANYDRTAKSLKDNNNLVIGTIIRLVEDKGVQYLVQAFVKLANKYPNIELWIVGDGNYRPELERLAAGHNRVKFWGFHSEPSAFYKSFDISVQPAEYEGWGRTVKEAMYFGLPIVGSNVGGIALQLEDQVTGLLFKAKSVPQLMDRLEKFITDPKLRAKIASHAQIKAETDGDFVKTVKDYIIPEFESLMAKKAGTES